MLEKVKAGFNKAKQLKQDIDYVNYMLGVVDCDNPTVELVHETPLMQKYCIQYQGKNGMRGATVVFSGSLVVFCDEKQNQRYMNNDGYMGWKLGILQKNLHNRVVPRVSFMTKLKQKIHDRQY